MKHEETAKRLRKAIEINNTTQRELSIKANISEASVSQYYNGSHKPSNISAGKMAEILNVDPMWLMGFDVPMNKEEVFDLISLGEAYGQILHDEKKSRFIKILNEVPDNKIDELSSYAMFLISQNKKKDE